MCVCVCVCVCVCLEGLYKLRKFLVQYQLIVLLLGVGCVYFTLQNRKINRSVNFELSI